MDIKIIYEDNDVLIVDKPAGIVVFCEAPVRSPQAKEGNIYLIDELIKIQYPKTGEHILARSHYRKILPYLIEKHLSFSFSDLEAFGSNSSGIGLSEKDGVYSLALKHTPTGKVGTIVLPASFGSWLDALRERLAAKTDGEEA